MTLPVALYTPNLIGYVRVLSGLASFLYAFGGASQPGAQNFVYLYAFSYALDALDGVAARRFKQESTFGAVLDMVTDRVCTAGLLAALAAAYGGAAGDALVEPNARLMQAVCVWLLMLDVGSHWLQMYR
jgi:CDP-diacylglycerol--inositol 3-phosphatidyltransferase